jgi:hypothetical protein
MTFQAGAILPAARAEDLVTTETADATLVYDLTRHELHQLNGVASTIWGLLDGTRTAIDVLLEARAILGAGVTIESVRLALATLAETNLLAESIEPTAFTAGTSRRRFLKKVGMTAAIPAIISVTAPLAAGATSTSASSCSEAVGKYGCANECSIETEGMLSCQQWQDPLPCKVCVNTAIGGNDRPWDYQWNSWWCSPANPFGARAGSC